MRKGQIKLLEKAKELWGENSIATKYIASSTETLAKISTILNILQVFDPKELAICEEDAFTNVIEITKKLDNNIAWRLRIHTTRCFTGNEIRYIPISEYCELTTFLLTLPDDQRNGYLEIYSVSENIEEMFKIAKQCTKEDGLKEFAKCYCEYIFYDDYQKHHYEANINNVIIYANYYAGLEEEKRKGLNHYTPKHAFFTCMKYDIPFEDAKTHDFDITFFIQEKLNLFINGCSCQDERYEKKVFNFPEDEKYALEKLHIETNMVIEYPVFFKTIKKQGYTFNIQFSRYGKTHIVYDKRENKYAYYGYDEKYKTELVYFLETNQFYRKYTKNKKTRLIPCTLRDLIFMKNIYEQNFMEFMIPWLEAQIKDSKVYLDILRLIKNQDFVPTKIIPPVPLFVFNGKQTLQEVMEAHYKKASSINWNKAGLQLGYAYYKLREDVDEKSQGILWQGLQKHYEYWDGDNNHHVLHTILMDRLTNYSKNEENYFIVLDYFNMCKQVHRKAKLTFRSMKKVEEAHNEVAIIQRNKYTPKITIPKDTKFKDLQKLLPKDEFEWIKNRRRIVQEGVEMHHCVASYAGSVNKDYCAIYSFVRKDNGHRYTIEFRKYRNQYYIEQMQARCNRGYIKEDYDYVEEFLSKSTIQLKETA